MRSEGQAEALKFGEEIFLVIDWGTGRREKEGAGIVRARYVATRGSSTFLRAFIFWFARVAQLLYGRGMPRPISISIYFGVKEFTSALGRGMPRHTPIASH